MNDRSLTAKQYFPEQVRDVQAKKPKKTIRVNIGESTNELVHSAYQDTNDDVFPHILTLYAKQNARIVDIYSNDS